MALAKGRSRIRTGAVTLHTQTAIHVAERLTQVCVGAGQTGVGLVGPRPSDACFHFQAKFTITKCEDEKSGSATFIIECEGSGVTNPYL